LLSLSVLREYVFSGFDLSGRNLFDIVFSLCIAVIMSLVISQIYKYTHRGMNYELSFMITLVILAPIVSIVMLFIRGDLVLSLGLIGSLSIIRFRTPIKDTRDMVFLFWVIAVGLGCGTYNWVVVIIATLFISIVMILLYFAKYGRSQNKDFVLVVSGNSPYNGRDIEEVINRYTREMRVRSHEVEENSWEVVFELRFSKLLAQSVQELITEIKSLQGVAKVSLLAPQLALPV
jgi:hypothetical protein